MAQEAVLGPQGIWRGGAGTAAQQQGGAVGGERRRGSSAQQRGSAGGQEDEEEGEAEEEAGGGESGAGTDGSSSGSDDAGEVDRRRLRLYERSKLRWVGRGGRQVDEGDPPLCRGPLPARPQVTQSCALSAPSLTPPKKEK